MLRGVIKGHVTGKIDQQQQQQQQQHFITHLEITVN